MRKTAARPEVLDRIRAYRALDNPLRLRAYTAIRDHPEASFHQLAKELGVESGLAAYHMGVLKAAGLIRVEYARKSRETSEYTLTPKGRAIYDDLFARPSSSKKGKKRTTH